MITGLDSSFWLGLVFGFLFFSLATVVFYFIQKKILNRSLLEINSLLSPLANQLKDQQSYLVETQRYDLKDRESLREKITHMLDSARRIEQEASSLTNALTSDVKFQGQWGEMILENIFQKIGLEKGRDYHTQVSLQSEDGKILRPDYIVNLPLGGEIIIDSKVSLSAYFELLNEENIGEADKKLKASIKQHISGLKSKDYAKLLSGKSPEFIYLFIPVEGVYQKIIQDFSELIDEALESHIILASPITILAHLKTIAFLWREEKQERNGELIAKKAGAMHDKFAGLVEDLQRLEVAIEKSFEAHHKVMKKLSEGRGDLLSQAKELEDLGAKTYKKIPTVELEKRAQ